MNNDAELDYFATNLCAIYPSNPQKGLTNEQKVLLRLNDLYTAIRSKSDYSERYDYDAKAAKKYLVYAMTLIKGGEPSFDNSAKKEYVASFLEASVFNSLSPAMKLYIYNQVQEVITKFGFTSRDLGFNVYSLNDLNFKIEEFEVWLQCQINDVNNIMKNSCEGLRVGSPKQI